MSTNVDLAKKIKTISALLAKADSTQEQYPEEAATYRAKAEQLQREYRIAEEHLIASDAAAAIDPEWTEVEVCRYHSPFRQTYVNLWAWAADHAGIKSRTVYVNGDYRAYAVGYAGDLRLAENLFNSARLVFQERMEPAVKPYLGDQVNAFRLRQAGIERNRIAQILWGADLGKPGAQAHRKVGQLYKAECEARGIDPTVAGRSVKVDDYRKAYAESFHVEFYWRLRKARSAADSVGGALALPGREERVAEAYYAKYPEARPSKDVAVAEKAEPCKKCEKAKSGHCRDHRPVSASEAERANRFRYSAAGRAGAAAGEAAAREVELAGPQPAQRLPEGEGTALMREIKSW